LYIRYMTAAVPTPGTRNGDTTISEAPSQRNSGTTLTPLAQTNQSTFTTYSRLQNNNCFIAHTGGPKNQTTAFEAHL